MKKSLIILILTIFIAGCSADTAHEDNQPQPKAEPAREAAANKSENNGSHNNTAPLVNQSVQSKNVNITISNGQTITSSETGVSYTVQSPAPESNKSKEKKGNKVGN